jgi:hypothetical protein
VTAIADAASRRARMARPHNPLGGAMALADRIRIEKVETLADDWAVLKKTTLAFQRADGGWQTLTRETYDRGNGATLLLVNRERGTVLLTRQFRMSSATATIDMTIRLTVSNELARVASVTAVHRWRDRRDARGQRAAGATSRWRGRTGRAYGCSARQIDPRRIRLLGAVVNAQLAATRSSGHMGM